MDQYDDDEDRDDGNELGEYLFSHALRMRDLEMLMVRYQQGDFAAATALIHRLSPQLHRFFVVQFASRGDADDLLQETWLRIHEVRHTYRAGEPVLPWLYAIARHIRVDHYRKARRTAAREAATGADTRSGGAPAGGIRRNSGLWKLCSRRFPRASGK